jgi:hypothetical protein
MRCHHTLVFRSTKRGTPRPFDTGIVFERWVLRCVLLLLFFSKIVEYFSVLVGEEIPEL